MRRAITDRPRPWWLRLAWFAGIWTASVMALGVVAMLLRWIVAPAA